MPWLKSNPLEYLQMICPVLLMKKQPVLSESELSLSLSKSHIFLSVLILFSMILSFSTS